MNANEYILLQTSEECSEITQAISKALRFGLHERYAKTPDLTNEDKIVGELNDLQAMIELCQEQGLLPKQILNTEAIAAKKQKVLKYMDYARNECGTLN